jgi:hypothetical protein
MSSDRCTAGSYNLQCYPHNDPGVAFSAQVSATGTHRTTGYEACFKRVGDEEGVPVLILQHERNKQPDLQMMTFFQVAFAFESPTNISKVKVIDAKGEHLIMAQDIPILISTCPA